MTEIKLVIAVPTAGMVRMGFAYSLAALIAKVAANGIPTLPECSVAMMLDVNESSVIHTNRELLVRRAIDRGNTHLLFLDDDMVFEPNILEIMLGRRQAVVACNYLIKTDKPNDFVAVSLTGKRVPTTKESTGLAPVAYTGFGVSLFDVDVFKKTPQPWFQPVFVPESSTYTTEDNPCYAKIREAGFNVYLDQDASKLVTHLGTGVWRWDMYAPTVVAKAAEPMSVKVAEVELPPVIQDRMSQEIGAGNGRNIA